MTTQNQLRRSTPEEQGIPSAELLAFIDEVDHNIQEMHSLMLLRHGQVVVEGWWSPYAPQHPHMLFSLSKSFTSTAVGMAVEEGLLSVDDPLISFFPEFAPAEVSENLAAMRVRHLLSMSTGHAEDTTGHLHEATDGCWVKAFLALPVEYEPGTHFLYNTGATYVLSAIVQKLTGMKLIDYLQPRLFEPLGIEGPIWEESPEGINTGGYGLNVKTEDIARFGQMYLQKGLWEGKRILSEAWIDEATSRQVSNGSKPESDWEQGYGYQFWRCRHNIYRGDGAFGQYCIVMPDQDAVLAITSAVADMQSVLNVVWEKLLPAMGPAVLPANPAAQRALAEKRSTLALVPPAGQTTAPAAESVSGKKFVMDANERQIESFSLQFSANECTFTIVDARGEHRVSAGLGAWKMGKSDLLTKNPLLNENYLLTAASGVWNDEGSFVLTARFYETPFFMTFTFSFQEKTVTVKYAMNVGFGPNEAPLMTGKTA